MGTFITFLIVMLCMPLIVVLALASLILLFIAIAPFIFIGWLIGELFK